MSYEGMRTIQQQRELVGVWDGGSATALHQKPRFGAIEVWYFPSSQASKMPNTGN
jgi:hypothetical protein